MTESKIQVGMSDNYLHTDEVTLADGTKAHDEYVRVAGTSANSATINASLLWRELF
jgi:hypothetical protein